MSRASASNPPDRQARILAAIAAIPRGRVATYGTVARAAGLPGRPRLVGRVLAGLPAASRVPWHRVVNADGKISRADEEGRALQRRRLAQEGVRFTRNGAACAEGGRIDAERYFWTPGAGNGARRRPGSA